MSDQVTGYGGAAVFEGEKLLQGHVLLVRDGVVDGVVAQTDVPKGVRVEALKGGTLAPGFVDLQVNGGGGVMLNDDPSVATLRRMARAHAQLGATTILPTLITDHVETTRAAIDAVERAIAARVAGIAGLHLEGPHLARARKGAHDGDLIRPMDDADLEMLTLAARNLPVLKITLAPENVTLDQMRALSGAGAVLSLGHTDASHDQCVAAAGAGVRCVTHLFNAMRQMTAREPGVVGAALAQGGLSAGMIADRVHVHGETMRLALAAKQGPGRIFLVSDAMAVAATDRRIFTLNGRQISRRNGRLTLADGTLAGADLDLATALQNLAGIGVPLAQGLAMATSVPANLIGLGDKCGHLRPGVAANFVHLDKSLHLTRVWHAGIAMSQG